MKSILDMYLNESLIKNDEDIYLNFDKWKKNTENNVLFITGFSGSGKSTLARELSKTNHAVMFEIDGIEHNDDSSGKDILKKVQKQFPLYNSDKIDRSYYQKMLEAAIDIMYNDINTLYIVEGVQLFQWFVDIDYFKNKPIIVKNTSMFKSILRRFKRNGNGKIYIKEELQNEFLQLLGWYMNDKKILNNFKKGLINNDR